MEWYTKWFGSEYISLYSHRDLEEARRQVAFVLDQFPPTGILQVLDIGCGFGRHVEMFLERGHLALGLDLSPELLAHSRALLGAELMLVRGDMRALPFADGSFDLLCNFFTGFGYFAGDQEHLALLAEWRRVQRAHGRLFLDYLNRDSVIATLAPKSENEDKLRTYTQERRISADGTRVEKQIRILDKQSGHISHFNESVRMYSLAELEQLLRQARFSILRTFGGFAYEPFSPTADRLLILAEAF